MKSQVPPALEALIAAARRDEPPNATLSRLADSVEKGQAPSSISKRSSVSSSPALNKGIVAIAACAVVAGAIVMRTMSDFGEPAHDAAPASAPTHAAPVSPTPPMIEDSDTRENVVPSIDVRSLPEPEKPSAVRKGGAAGPGATSRVEGPSEGTLLHQAHDAISSDPRRAFDLTIEHARRFPNGMLVQEREVIAIEALARMGRTDEARRRASSFFATYPSSAYRSRVNDAVGVASTGSVLPPSEGTR